MQSMPKGADYTQAVQNPQVHFFDSDLRDAQVRKNQLGMPKPYSGGFTTTFQMKGRSDVWAVRCFTRPIPDIEKRYAEIERFIAIHRHRVPFLVQTNYLPNGIQVGGTKHPVVKMEWVDGKPLNAYVEDTISNSGSNSAGNRVRKLADSFLDLVKRLRQLGIAHGDLQHGNIVVKSDGSLCLVDYDGMYLPSLASLQGSEFGHINYQHPGREELPFGPDIDRFSSIVIYVGLLSVSERPDLWRKFENGENILFKREDYLNPQQSALMRELRCLPCAGGYTDSLMGICTADVAGVPDIERFLSNSRRVPHVSPHGPAVAPTWRSQYDVIDASNVKKIGSYVGGRVTIVGKLEQTKVVFEPSRLPYAFLNFGMHPDQTCSLVLWARALSSLAAPPGVSLQDHCDSLYRDKWVSVTGVVGEWRGKLQVEIEMVSQIVNISESEARKRLSHAAPPVPPIDHAVHPFKTIYGDGSVSGAQIGSRPQPTQGPSPQPTPAVPGPRQPATPTPVISPLPTTRPAQQPVSGLTGTVRTTSQPQPTHVTNPQATVSKSAQSATPVITPRHPSPSGQKPHSMTLGWRFRKLFQFGPFRLNLSRRGIGTSIGIPGLRYGIAADGTRYISIGIPGTGIYWRKTLGKPQHQSPPP